MATFLHNSENIQSVKVSSVRKMLLKADDGGDDDDDAVDLATTTTSAATTTWHGTQAWWLGETVGVKASAPSNSLLRLLLMFACSPNPGCLLQCLLSFSLGCHKRNENSSRRRWNWRIKSTASTKSLFHSAFPFFPTHQRAHDSTFKTCVCHVQHLAFIVSVSVYLFSIFEMAQNWIEKLAERCLGELSRLGRPEVDYDDCPSVY